VTGTQHSTNGRYIVLTFRAFAEDGVFVSECVELQTASQGDSPEEAIDNAREATDLYLETIAGLGEQERVLRERGIDVLTAVPEEIELHANVHPSDIVKPIVYVLPGRTPIPA
jgi:predicted RNase H-like HicB family nuclease